MTNHIDVAAQGAPAPQGVDDLDFVPSTGPSRHRGSGRRDVVASSATVVAFFGVFVAYGLWLGGDFLDVKARMFDLTSSAPQLMLAIGLVVCLACHQFDLSVGAMATLSVFLTIGLHVKSNLPMAAAIAVALGVGILGGLANGLLVTRLRLNAFIATLGTGGVFGGLTVVYSSGQVIGPSPETRTLPKWFTGPGSLGDFQEKVPAVVGWAAIAAVIIAFLISYDQRFPATESKRLRQRIVLAAIAAALLSAVGVAGIVRAIAWTVFILIVVSMALWVFLKYTNVGRSVYAIGGSAKAASFAGIRTDAITVLVFVISGFVAALTGVLLASVQGSAVPGIADSLLLPAYAAVFLSTVLISRGRFHVWGTLAGGLFLVYVSAGLVEGGVKFTWTQVINGLVLVATVAGSTILRKK
jgi:ribose/xylose/arabinose/galactoside ABC-type transport system permease subunit